MEYCPYCKARVVKRGTNKSGIQQFYCKICNKWLLDTVNYTNNFSPEEVTQICKYIIDGKSIREISKITGHHRDTISKLIDHIAWVSVAPRHCLDTYILLPRMQRLVLWFTLRNFKKKWSPELKQRLMEAGSNEFM